MRINIANGTRFGKTVLHDILGQFRMSKALPKEFKTAFSTYKWIDQIGAGGTGTVHKVSDDTGRNFALKVLAPDRVSGVSSERRKRFKNEIVFGVKNTHPNVITIVDHGAIETSKGTMPFYVMPLFTASLRVLMKKGIPRDSVLPYFSQILNGVEAGHLQGIVHRDLKPENVLHNATNDTLVIADWGIAHFTQDELYTLVDTNPGSRLANFTYASPEQRQHGATVGARADIYALGLILNELFTQQVPHGTGYTTIQSVANNLAYLDSLVESMIRQRAEDRPESIDQIKQQLIARKNEFISRQILSDLKQTVLPTTEVGDDPILQDPIRLVGADYRGGVLSLTLNQAVPPEWIQALHGMGNYSSVLGKEPYRFTFQENVAQVPAHDHELQAIVDHFKTWLPQANSAYRYNRERKLHDREQTARERLQRRIDEEEKRLKALQSLRI
jgi:serine/threonine protein kinase